MSLRAQIGVQPGRVDLEVHRCAGIRRDVDVRHVNLRNLANDIDLSRRNLHIFGHVHVGDLGRTVRQTGQAPVGRQVEVIHVSAEIREGVVAVQTSLRIGEGDRLGGFRLIISQPRLTQGAVRAGIETARGGDPVLGLEGHGFRREGICRLVDVLPAGGTPGRSPHGPCAHGSRCASGRRRRRIARPERSRMLRTGRAVAATGAVGHRLATRPQEKPQDDAQEQQEDQQQDEIAAFGHGAS